MLCQTCAPAPPGGLQGALGIMAGKAEPGLQIAEVMDVAGEIQYKIDGREGHIHREAVDGVRY